MAGNMTAQFGLNRRIFDYYQNLTDRITGVLEMLYDEKKAIEGIRELPSEVSQHLQHIYRNGLQTILACIETGHLNEAKRQIRRIAENLREVGL